MKERLIEFLKYIGIGQDKFEKNVGLSRGFVNKVGDSIRVKNQQKIQKCYPELNMTWLLVGEGSMLLTKNSTLPGVKCTNPDCLNKIEQLTRDLKTANEDKSLLKEHIALLKGQIEQLKSEKGAMEPEKRDQGSVEKPGETDRKAS